MIRRTHTGFSFSGYLGSLHYPVLLLIFILLGWGMMMLYSAAGGAMYPWAGAQLTRAAVGVVFMLGIAALPLRFLFRHCALFYGACILLLIAVDVAGHMGMGAQRWFAIGSVTLQPSEITKIATILIIARYFHDYNPLEKRHIVYLVPPLLLMALPAFFIMRQPNLGTTTILVVTGITICFAAGAMWRYFIAALIMGMIAVPVMWEFVMHDYQKQRVLTFLNPQEDPLGTGYNIIQSIIAIGSGGLTGKGYLQGSQGQLDFLPEKQTDFIFTMLAEEFGFVGSAAVIVLYFALILCALHIGWRCRHRFGALVATGLAAMLFLHLFINVGMSMGLLPVVGVPLPLFSYGGTMLVTILIGFGVLLNMWVHRSELLPERGKGL